MRCSWECWGSSSRTLCWDTQRGFLPWLEYWILVKTTECLSQNNKCLLSRGLCSEKPFGSFELGKARLGLFSLQGRYAIKPTEGSCLVHLVAASLWLLRQAKEAPTSQSCGRRQREWELLQGDLHCCPPHSLPTLPSTPSPHLALNSDVSQHY
jgi:hypothetical protein